MGYFIHLPPTEDILRPNEHIACSNASIIVDEEDNFCGWFDNDSLIMKWFEDEVGE